jgi:hypothetical protein
VNTSGAQTAAVGTRNTSNLGTITPDQRLRGFYNGGVMSGDFNDTERWLTLAEEAIAVARELSESESRRLMLFIANAYKRLAARAQERKNQKS